MTQEEYEKKDARRRRVEAFKNTISSMNDADKQRLVTYFAYIAVILLAVLSSSLNLIFDPKNFDFKRYVISVCFTIAFSTIALLLSLKDGRLSNETRRKGELYETKKELIRKCNNYKEN